jgi:hypothetical protein
MSGEEPEDGSLANFMKMSYSEGLHEFWYIDLLALCLESRQETADIECYIRF